MGEHIFHYYFFLLCLHVGRLVYTTMLLGSFFLKYLIYPDFFFFFFIHGSVFWGINGLKRLSLFLYVSFLVVHRKKLVMQKKLHFANSTTHFFFATGHHFMTLFPGCAWKGSGSWNSSKGIHLTLIFEMRLVWVKILYSHCFSSVSVKTETNLSLQAPESPDLISNQVLFTCTLSLWHCHPWCVNRPLLPT